MVEVWQMQLKILQDSLANLLQLSILFQSKAMDIHIDQS